ncbi:unnamed protein product [Leptidea sinapis]|uniref:Uncharacterized protein n=1 Tax=Leptidea sinapis TaxID=189913 RepID=A0A5E4PYL8_9NEOP|nr:unnamed protein product [Leptidea sinapis]
MSWCLRRAELVLKCVKGFMLETSAAGGTDLRTLTVLLPAAAPQLFQASGQLLTSIFRLASPKTNPSFYTMAKNYFFNSKFEEIMNYADKIYTEEQQCTIYYEQNEIKSGVYS